LSGDYKTVFCATRPPGHHAEPTRATGFCFFNNIAIAAREAMASGLGRVAILDFDVHHGNGTQAVFWNDPDVLYASTHQYPCYPWTGAPEEQGVGNIINRPLAPGSGSEPFRESWNGILEEVAAFRPEMILTSAGFDGHRLDPLADLNLETEDFAWLTGQIRNLAGEYCSGRVVSVLEGGYDLKALADSVVAHVTALHA
jgi:acetoin utilization deacetylase AcuC-like enzyme